MVYVLVLQKDAAFESCLQKAALCTAASCHIKAISQAPQFCGAGQSNESNAPLHDQLPSGQTCNIPSNSQRAVQLKHIDGKVEWSHHEYSKKSGLSTFSQCARAAPRQRIVS